MFNWLAATRAGLWNRSLGSSKRLRGRQRHPGQTANVSAMAEQLESRQLLSVISVDIGGDTYTTGHTTLRDAIAKANADGSGDTIVFSSNLAGKAITLTHGAYVITSSVTIIAPSNGGITIDAGGTSRVFNISNGTASKNQNVTLIGLGMENGAGLGSNGGAIYNAANLTLANDTLNSSTAIDGGGIYNLGKVVSTSDTITGDSATLGGGVYNAHGATFTSSNDTIVGNEATNGGGIDNFGAASLINDTIAANGAVFGFGGGIFNGAGATMTSTNDSIWSNTSTDGGGIANQGLFQSTNDTIAVNGSLAGFGGGIYNSSTGSFTATNDTVSGNSAIANGVAGGIDNGGKFNAVNTLVVGNTANGLPSDAIVGIPLATGSHNLIGIPAGQTLANILHTVPGALPLQPLLANNGGPTQTIGLVNNATNPALGKGTTLATLTAAIPDLTTNHFIVTSSTFLAVGDLIRIDTEVVKVTAISGTTITVVRGQAGTDPTTHKAGAAVYVALDQRGFARTTNDIGAVSGPQTSLVVTSTGDTNAAGPLTLRNAILAANGDGSGDVITFAPGLVGQTITLTQGELLITGSMTITGLGAGMLTIDGHNASRIFDIDDGNGATVQKVTITGLTLQHGNGTGVYSTGAGGAIHNAENLTLANTAILANSAFQGGAIENDGSITLTSSTIAGNQAAWGGGLANTGTAYATNVTIADNSVTGFGGGIFNAGGTMTATNDTVAGNSAGIAGGGILNEGIFNALNTLVVGNTTNGAADDFDGNTLAAGGRNLIGVPAGLTLSDIVRTDASGKPLLVNNGGPTSTIQLASNPLNPALGSASRVATLTAPIPNATTTSIHVTGPMFLVVGELLQIDGELMKVNAISGTSITVARGQGGTTARTHQAGAAVYLGIDQRGFPRNTNDIGAVQSSQTTLYVTSTSDGPADGFLTLRQAIMEANADGIGDTIIVAPGLTGKTIFLTQGPLLVTGAMTIIGSDVTIDGNHTSRIFNVDDGNPNTTPTVVISEFMLQNGNGSGPNSFGFGGAVYNAENLILVADTINSNSAAEGGGIDNDGTLTLNNDAIWGNSAGIGGGIANSGTLTMNQNTISGNSAPNGGGGIYNNAGSLLSTNETIYGNSANLGSGGGLLNEATARLINDTLSQNAANYGNAIVNQGSLILTNDTVAGNLNHGVGGGIVNLGATYASNLLDVGNSPKGSATDFVGTPIAGGSHNLIGLPIGMSLSNVLQTDASGNPVLMNNGGPTPTIALSVSSTNPALGKAGSLATLLTAIPDNTTTSATVNNATFLIVGEFLRIDNETVKITSIGPSTVNGTTINFVRGQNGTTATSHFAGAGVFLDLDQRGLNRNPPYDIGAFETQAATIQITIASGTYTGKPFAVTNAVVRGVNGETLASFGDPSITYAYYAGILSSTALALAMPLSGPPTAVGNYTVVAKFTSKVPGYRNTFSAPTYFQITPA